MVVSATLLRSIIKFFHDLSKLIIGMLLTTEILKEMIIEELKVQTKKQVEREKEGKRISNQRKRSWDEDTYKLAKGIFTEGEQEIELSVDDPPEKLIKAIMYLQKENERLRSQLSLDANQVASLCKRNGYRTYKSFLDTINSINAAEKGKLYPKK